MDLRTHCPDEQVLLDHLLGELPPDELVIVDEHLKLCAHCRAMRWELAQETGAIERAVDQDVFPSHDRVRQARHALHESFAEYERGRESLVPAPVVLQDASVSGRAAATAHRWFAPLAAAAAVVVGIGLAAWFWRTSPPVDAAGVLSRVQQAESANAGQPLFQRFRVELMEVEPQIAERAGYLETWSDPAGERFASRWIDPAGSLQHAVWNRVEDHKVVTSIYSASSGAKIVTAAGERGGRGTLLAVGREGLSTDALAKGFVRWIESRPLEPVSLTSGLIELSDESGMRVEVARLPDTAGRLRLTARRRSGDRTATITLDVDEQTYRPLQLRIRFEGAGGVAELAIVGEEVRVLSAGALDPIVFEPRVPDESLRVARGSQPDVSSRTARRTVTLMPSLEEKLNTGLRVRYAIHQAGLCAGGPISIAEEDSGIAVTGVVNSPNEKVGLLDRLAGLKLPDWVSVEIRTVEEAASQTAADPASSATEARSVGAVSGADNGVVVAEAKLPIQDELEEYFAAHPLSTPGSGSQTGREDAGLSSKIMTFANEAVTTSESGLAHAMELRRLAELYGNATQRLSPDAVARLREMLADHLVKFRASAADARHLMSPVLEAVAAKRGLSTTDRTGTAAAAASWSDACENVFREANRIHGSVVALLAVHFDGRNFQAEPGSDPNRAIVELLDALRAVEADTNSVSRQVAGLQKRSP